MNIQEIIEKIKYEKDKYIVVGVSAGPDSMALLHIVKNNINCKIVCAHINHNVRKESEKEQEYLEKYCQYNNIIFETMKILSYTKKNFENEAREKRYNFYEKILKKYNSHTLLLAHHGDDLIETILMKIMRGSNLEGYAGIKTYSYLKNYKIIRPLLSYTKEDILTYNKNNNIKYFEDYTNKENTYTRNRYRKNILPFLKQEDNKAHLKFLKYSNTLIEYFNFIEETSNKTAKKIIKDNKIDISKLKKENILIRKNIIFNFLSEIYNNKANIIKEKHINDIIKLTKSDKPNIRLNLPNNIIIKKEYNFLIIDKQKKDIDNYKFEVTKTNKIDDIIIELIDKTKTNGNNVCRLDSQKIKLPLYLRNKKDGDYIEVLGLNGKRKIKDIFIDSKIPKSKRETYPLLVDSNDRILWIPNIKKSKYNVKKDEFCDIILTSHKEREEINEK